MTKRDFERARDRDRGRAAARESYRYDSPALQWAKVQTPAERVSSNVSDKRVLRKVTCERCGHSAHVATLRFAVLKVRCSKCGLPQVSAL
jgi:hypothetical protein